MSTHLVIEMTCDFELVTWILNAAVCGSHTVWFSHAGIHSRLDLAWEAGDASSSTAGCAACHLLSRLSDRAPALWPDIRSPYEVKDLVLNAAQQLKVNTTLSFSLSAPPPSATLHRTQELLFTCIAPYLEHTAACCGLIQVWCCCFTACFPSAQSRRGRLVAHLWTEVLFQLWAADRAAAAERCRPPPDQNMWRSVHISSHTSFWQNSSLSGSFRCQHSFSSYSQEI